MKQSDVVVGGVYSNGKGRSRKVVDMGPQYKLYNSQENADCLKYEVVKGPKGQAWGVMTKIQFSRWAKERIE